MEVFFFDTASQDRQLLLDEAAPEFRIHFVFVASGPVMNRDGIDISFPLKDTLLRSR
jgi:hypothetical protein